MRSLTDWLHYIESTHPSEIELGLSRVKQVAQQLALDLSGMRVITVGGTNGKGTTCAFLQNAALYNDLKVGVYTSPHIVDFRERITINGEWIQADALCAIFAQIDNARSDIPLTYFEFSTLAALLAFQEAQLDLAILEVGLGGRLDAVNIIDADIAVITSIGLDHQDWLGNTREAIAAEKAGIFRRDQAIVIGESDCPTTMLNAAKSLSADINVAGRDFVYDSDAKLVSMCIVDGAQKSIFDVSNARIPKPNIATAAIALQRLAELDPRMSGIAKRDCLEHCIVNTQVAGRHQCLRNPSASECAIYADVAHNEASAIMLRSLIEADLTGTCHLVLGMLKDKNIEASVAAFSGLQIKWYCASLPGSRGADAERLKKAVKLVVSDESQIQSFDSVKSAYKAAKKAASTTDTILVMGSFLTVAAVVAVESEA